MKALKFLGDFALRTIIAYAVLVFLVGFLFVIVQVVKMFVALIERAMNSYGANEDFVGILLVILGCACIVALVSLIRDGTI